MFTTQYSLRCTLVVLLFLYSLSICLSAPSPIDFPSKGKQYLLKYTKSFAKSVISSVVVLVYHLAFSNTLPIVIMVFAFSENNFSCYNIQCPKGTVACKRLQTTSKDGSKLVTEVECQDEQGKS